MDWNANSSLLWDWDNHEPSGGSYKLSATAGGGSSSGSDLGNGSSSKSTISASTASSKTAKSSDWEANPKNCDKNVILLENGSSPVAVQMAGLEESQIGLKLGRRTYFENVSAENSGKNSLSALDSVAAPGSLVKKPKVAHQIAQSAFCQVQGCSVDLSGAKDYHRKHRVCEAHSKYPKVVVGGQERRFCQQCSRFHDLSEFDQKKRSCRRRLSDHNARRRKPRPNIISFSSTHSPFYAVFDHGRTMVGTTIEEPHNFKFTQMREQWMKPTKEVNIDGQLPLPNAQFLNAFPSLYHEGDKLLPLEALPLKYSIKVQKHLQELRTWMEHQAFGVLSLFCQPLRGFLLTLDKLLPSSALWMLAHHTSLKAYCKLSELSVARVSSISTMPNATFYGNHLRLYKHAPFDPDHIYSCHELQ